MRKRMAYMVISLAIIFGGIFGVIAVKKKMINDYMANYTPPPVTVSAYPAKQRVWERHIKSIGTLYAVNGVDIASEVGGIVRDINFLSGERYKKGAVLINLDDRIEQANLKSLLAQQQLARIIHSRDKKLLETHAISKTDFDTVEAKLKDVDAQVERTRAVIALKQITAPFDGQLGIREVNIGQYLNVGESIVTLQDLSSLYIDFSLPEKYLPDISIKQRVRFSVAAYQGENFSGEVSAINAKVDGDTRNILVRALINNADKKLLPGMFASLQLVMEKQETVVSVPQTAISYSLFGNSVFVVTDKQMTEKKITEKKVEKDANEDKGSKGLAGLVVERVYVKVGRQKGDEIAIIEGVSVNQLVVTAGQLKLSNGASVLIDNSIKL